MPGGLNPMFGVVGKGIPHESYLRERERETIREVTLTSSQLYYTLQPLFTYTHVTGLTMLTMDKW